MEVQRGLGVAGRLKDAESLRKQLSMDQELLSQLLLSRSSDDSTPVWFLLVHVVHAPSAVGLTGSQHQVACGSTDAGPSVPGLQVRVRYGGECRSMGCAPSSTKGNSPKGHDLYTAACGFALRDDGPTSVAVRLLRVGPDTSEALAEDLELPLHKGRTGTAELRADGGAGDDNVLARVIVESKGMPRGLLRHLLGFSGLPRGALAGAPD